MFKRIMKIFFIILSFLIVFIGGAIGVFAIAGGFKNETINVNKLYFDVLGEEKYSIEEYVVSDYSNKISFLPLNATNKSLTVRVTENPSAVDVPSSITAGEKFVIKLKKDINGNNIGGGVKIQFASVNGLVACDLYLLIEAPLLDNALYFSGLNLVPSPSSDPLAPKKFITASSNVSQEIRLNSEISNSLSISRSSALSNSFTKYSGMKKIYYEKVDNKNTISSISESADKKYYFFSFTPKVTGEDIKIKVKVHRTFEIEQEYIKNNFNELLTPGYSPIKLVEFNTFINKYLNYFNKSDKGNKFFNDRMNNGVVDIVDEADFIQTAIYYVFSHAEICITIADVSLDSIEIMAKSHDFTMGTNEKYTITNNSNQLKDTFGITINPLLDDKMTNTEEQSARDVISSQLSNVTLKAFVISNTGDVTNPDYLTLGNYLVKLGLEPDLTEGLTEQQKFNKAISSGITNNKVILKWEKIADISKITDLEQQLMNGTILKIKNSNKVIEYFAQRFYKIEENNFLKIEFAVENGGLCWKLIPLVPTFDKKVSVFIRFEITMVSKDTLGEKTRFVDLGNISIDYTKLSGNNPFTLDALSDMCVNDVKTTIKNSGDIAKTYQELSYTISGAEKSYYDEIRYFVVGSSNIVNTFKAVFCEEQKTVLSDKDLNPLVFDTSIVTDSADSKNFFEIKTTFDNDSTKKAIKAINATGTNKVQVFATIILTKNVEVNGVISKVPCGLRGQTALGTEENPYIYINVSPIREFQIFSFLSNIIFYSKAQYDTEYYKSAKDENNNIYNECIPVSKGANISRNITNNDLEMNFKSIKLIVGLDSLYQDMIYFTNSNANIVDNGVPTVKPASEVTDTSKLVDTEGNLKKAIDYAITNKLLKFSITGTDALNPTKIIASIEAADATNSIQYKTTTDGEYVLSLKGLISGGVGTLNVSTANSALPYIEISNKAKIEVFDIDINKAELTNVVSKVGELTDTVTNLDAVRDDSKFLRFKNGSDNYQINYLNNVPEGLKVETDLENNSKITTIAKDQTTGEVTYFRNLKKLDFIFNYTGSVAKVDDIFVTDKGTWSEFVKTRLTNEHYSTIKLYSMQYIIYNGHTYFIENDKNERFVTIDGDRKFVTSKIGKEFGVIIISKGATPSEDVIADVIDNSKFLDQNYYNTSTREITLRKDGTSTNPETKVVTNNYVIPFKYSTESGNTLGIRFKYLFDNKTIVDINNAKHFNIDTLYNIKCMPVTFNTPNGQNPYDLISNPFKIDGGKSCKYVDSEQLNIDLSSSGGVDILNTKSIDNSYISIMMGTTHIEKFCTFKIINGANAEMYFMKKSGAKWVKCYERKGFDDDTNGSTTLHLFSENTLELANEQIEVTYIDDKGDVKFETFAVKVNPNLALKPSAPTPLKSGVDLDINNKQLKIYLNQITEPSVLLTDYFKITDIKTVDGNVNISAFKIHAMTVGNITPTNSSDFLEISPLHTISIKDIGQIYSPIYAKLQFDFSFNGISSSYNGSNPWEIVVYPKNIYTLNSEFELKYVGQSIYSSVVKLTEYNNPTTEAKESDYSKIISSFVFNGVKTSAGVYSAIIEGCSLENAEIKAIIDNFFELTGKQPIALGNGDFSYKFDSNFDNGIINLKNIKDTIVIPIKVTFNEGKYNSVNMSWSRSFNEFVKIKLGGIGILKTNMDMLKKGANPKNSYDYLASDSVIKLRANNTYDLREIVKLTFKNIDNIDSTKNFEPYIYFTLYDLVGNEILLDPLASSFMRWSAPTSNSNITIQQIVDYLGIIIAGKSIQANNLLIVDDIKNTISIRLQVHFLIQVGASAKMYNVDLNTNINHMEVVNDTKYTITLEFVPDCNFNMTYSNPAGYTDIDAVLITKQTFKEYINYPSANNLLILDDTTKYDFEFCDESGNGANYSNFKLESIANGSNSITVGGRIINLKNQINSKGDGFCFIKAIAYKLVEGNWISSPSDNKVLKVLATKKI